MRQLAVNVSIVANGFPYTLFADGPHGGAIDVKNNATITGDAYASTIDQTKNNLDAQSVTSQASIIVKNNASYTGTLWSAGNIELQNGGAVGGSAIASGTASGTQGTIALSGATVGLNAIAKGGITGSQNVPAARVFQNNPTTPAPPVQHKPVFNTFDPLNYSPVPTTASCGTPGAGCIGNAAQVTSALAAQKASLKGAFYSNEPAPASVIIPAGANVTGPLTIVSLGKVSVTGDFNTSSSCTPSCQVVVVALSTACDPDVNAFSVDGKFVGADGLDILWYSLGCMDAKNGVTFTGAIYADSIAIKNNLTISKSTSLVTNPPIGFTYATTVVG